MTAGVTPPPMSARTRWSSDEDQRLRALADERYPIDDIAQALGRTVEGVRGRAQKLGIRLTSARRSWRPRYVPPRSPDQEK